MEKVRIDSVENRTMPSAVMHPLTDALGAEDLAINYYELESGDSFAFASHEHGIQEEVFYVQRGTATFETEAGDVEVDAGELVRFPPGEFQRGWNHGEERVVALALGAPLEYGEMTKLRRCSDCDAETDNRIERRSAADTSDAEETVVAVCEDCGAITGRWTEGPTDGQVD